jgi:hypothetical protein
MENIIEIIILTPLIGGLLFLMAVTIACGFEKDGLDE